MIEATGQIESLDGDHAWVATQRQSSCGSCSVSKGCGTSTVAKLFGDRLHRVYARNEVNAREGDSVVVGISEATLVKGSLMLYLLPLLALMAGGLLGELMAGQMGLNGELGALFMAVLGFIISLLWLKRYSGRLSKDERYQAVVLRRVESAGLGGKPIQWTIPN